MVFILRTVKQSSFHTTVLWELLQCYGAVVQSLLQKHILTVRQWKRCRKKSQYTHKQICKAIAFHLKPNTNEETEHMQTAFVTSPYYRFTSIQHRNATSLPEFLFLFTDLICLRIYQKETQWTWSFLSYSISVQIKICIICCNMKWHIICVF